MTPPRKPGFVLPVAVTLAVVLGLYVGAYYATVLVYPVAGESGNDEYHDVDYDVSGLVPEAWIFPAYERSFAIFAPIHWLDRRIRPHVWEPTP